MSSNIFSSYRISDFKQDSTTFLPDTKKHFKEQNCFRRYIPGQKCDSHMRIAGED